MRELHTVKEYVPRERTVSGIVTDSRPEPAKEYSPTVWTEGGNAIPFSAVARLNA